MKAPLKLGLFMTILFRLFFVILLTLNSLCHARQDPPKSDLNSQLDAKKIENISVKLDSKWEEPCFSNKQSISSHIFREATGHFKHDTPENRKYLLDAVSSPANRVGTTKYGVEIYFQMMPDGSQAWAEVYKNIITNGGCNRFPLKWVENPARSKGGELISVKYQKPTSPENEFKIRLQFNKLIETYNFHHPKHSFPLRNVTTKPAQGVEHQTGLILNLFDESNADSEDEHSFFMPTPEGLFLNESEIQQILSELARGIFFYDNIPFFSLHFNQDLAQYPILHPAYRDTLIGYLISMLDYSMKGFVNGFYYDEDFVVKWDSHPSLDTNFLKAHSVNLKEYCQEHLKISYLTLEEIRQQLGRNLPKGSINQEMYKHTFRIIAKQNSIKRTDNIFLLDGDFDVLYSLEPLPGVELTPIQHQLEEKTCALMCKQIKEIMPRLPLFKRYFQSLSLINFFSYYYTTLKEANKVIALMPLSLAKNPNICPSAFPPFPVDSSDGRLEIKTLSLWDSIPYARQQAIVTCFRADQSSSESQKNAIESLARALAEFAKSKLPSDHALFETIDWDRKAAILLSIMKGTDAALFKKMEASLVVLGLKKAGDPITEKIIKNLISKLDASIEQTNSFILEIEGELQQQGPNIELLTELANFKKQKENFILNKQMWLFWSQGSIIPSLDKTVIALNPENQDLLIYPERYKGVPLIAGGFGLCLSDTTAESDPMGAILLDRYGSALSKLRYGQLLLVPSHAAGQPSGVFFKLAFLDFPTISPEEKQLSLEYYGTPDPKNSCQGENTYAFHAIATDDENLFNKVVTHIKDWDFSDFLGISILHYAASGENPLFLKHIINQKVDVNSRDPLGYTALHYAAQYGNLSSLETLLQKAPHLLDTLSKDGESALYVAVQNNQPAAVKYLIQAGANPDLKTRLGMNILMCSIYMGHEEIALELLDHTSIDLEQSLLDRSTVFHFAMEEKMGKVAERLCDMGCNASRTRIDGYTPLHIAADQGWLPGVQLLLRKCPYINFSSMTKSGDTAIQLAASHQHLEIEDLLRKYNAESCTRSRK